MPRACCANSGRLRQRASSRGPTRTIDLWRPCNRQRARRYVIGHSRAGRDQSAPAYPDRRNQLRVAPDEDVILDHRFMLTLAIIVTRDGSGSNVHPLPDLGIAHIAEMVGL